MSPKQLQSLITKTLGLSARKPRSLEALLQDCARFYRYGDLPFEVNTAVEGIAWTLSTGRLYGALDAAVRGMSGSLAVALIATVAVSCNVIGDVPHWLIANADVLIPRQAAA